MHEPLHVPLHSPLIAPLSQVPTQTPEQAPVDGLPSHVPLQRPPQVPLIEPSQVPLHVPSHFVAVFASQMPSQLPSHRPAFCSQSAFTRPAGTDESQMLAHFVIRLASTEQTGARTTSAAVAFGPSLARASWTALIAAPHASLPLRQSPLFAEIVRDLRAGDAELGVELVGEERRSPSRRARRP